jgi:hypothetical protein
MLREMYQVVLNEAIRPGELSSWLNGARLVEAWPDLYLPRGGPAGVGRSAPDPAPGRNGP